MGRSPPREDSEASRALRSAGLALFVILALPLAVIAAGGLFGLGLERSLPPWLSGSVALVMVLVPSFGLRAVLSGSRSTSPLALFLWSLGLLVCLPLYVGDFPSSVRLGLNVALSPAGEPIAEGAARLGSLVAGRLSEGGRPSLPRAAEIRDDVQGPAVDLITAELPGSPAFVAEKEEQGEVQTVTLAVDGEGMSLKVQAMLESEGRSREVQFLFDTGATLTTLDRRTLRELGVDVSEDAPTATLQTAAGQVESSVVLLDRLWLGSVAIENVAVAVCEPCAQEETRGLLGLNVTSLFDVTMNSGEQELRLRPVSVSGDRRLDVNHFVQLDATVTMWRLGRVEVAVEASNAAEVPISELVVELVCGERSFAVQIDDVAAGDSAGTELELPRGTDCRTYQVILRSARW
jgi:clan AA aspartic protease (TIGR02281 family)